MLASLQLIHMNGRIYDPVIGRFLSADPFVQAPYNLQSYNRYSYVLNNPLKYTDPSGYFFGKIGKKIGKWVGFAVATYIGGPIGAGLYKAGINSYRAARNGAGAFGIFKAAAAGFAKGYVKAGGGGPSFGQNVKRGFKLGRRAHGIYKNRGNPMGLAFASLDAAGELFGSKTLNKGYEDLGDGTILIEGHRVPLLAGGGSAIRAERSWWNRLKEGLVRGAGLQPGDGFLGTNLSFGEMALEAATGARWLPETVGRSVAEEIRDHGSITVDAGLYHLFGANLGLSLDFKGLHGNLGLGFGKGFHFIYGGSYSLPTNNANHNDVFLISNLSVDLSYGNGRRGIQTSFNQDSINVMVGRGIAREVSVNLNFSGTLMEF